MRQEHREIYLWDLAGQSGYRLVHQLHLDEVAVALIVFSDKGGGDPLAGVAYWERALHTVRSVQGSASLPIKKFLVEARTDLAHVKMSAEQIEEEMRRLGFDAYFDTSALKRLDAYASALVNAVSADREGLGAIVETMVLEGSFPFPEGVRLAD